MPASGAPAGWPADIRTRTTLTTRPGDAPLEGATSGPPGEFWYPALALPKEPSLPSRWRPLLIALVIATIIVSALYGGWRITQRGTNFDPALDREVGAPASAVLER